MSTGWISPKAYETFLLHLNVIKNNICLNFLPLCLCINQMINTFILNVEVNFLLLTFGPYLSHQAANWPFALWNSSYFITARPFFMDRRVDWLLIIWWQEAAVNTDAASSGYPSISACFWHLMWPFFIIIYLFIQIVRPDSVRRGSKSEQCCNVFHEFFY